MSKIVYLPLDERPCNVKYPIFIANITDIDVVVPPITLLGQKKQPAEYTGIAQWLGSESTDADYLLLSIDMLVYGGIVPSRLHHLSESDCKERLELIIKLKEANPSLRIYAFNLIMRAPAYNGNDEEPDYYDTYGYNLYRYGWLQDKRESEELTTEENHEWEQIMKQVPSDVLNDFLQRRTLNAYVNKLAVQYVNQGIIDHLVIPLDDNSKYGFSPMEQRKLLFEVEAKDLMDRVLIYPGADEIACTIFSRIFCELKNYRPEVFVRYSSTHGPSIIPRYEDRSLNESIKSHLNAAGAFVGDSSSEADYVLMVHSPPVSQSEAAEAPNPYSSRNRAYFSEVNIAEFVTAIERIADKGQMVALADVAASNGGDPTLMRLLSKKGLLNRISAYAGWNTSGNTLGTVIAHAIVESYYRKDDNRSNSSEAASRQFLLYRFIEDWGYQSIVRTDVNANHLFQMGGDYFNIAHIYEPMTQLITDKLKQFCREYLPGISDEAVDTLRADSPWKRMFETDISF